MEESMSIDVSLFNSKLSIDGSFIDSNLYQDKFANRFINKIRSFYILTEEVIPMGAHDELLYNKIRHFYLLEESFIKKKLGIDNNKTIRSIYRFDDDDKYTITFK